VKEDCAGSVSDTDGSSANTTAITILGGSRVQEGTRPAKDKLERRDKERYSKNGTHLGRAEGSSPPQTRGAPVCGPVRSLGRGLNQSQISHLTYDVAMMSHPL